MKTLIALLFFTGSMMAQVALNTIKQDNIASASTVLNGPVLSGNTFYHPKIVGSNDKGILFVDLDTKGKKISEFVEVTNETPVPSWFVTKEIIVKYGHQLVERKALLAPNKAYNINHNCEVTGNVVYDDLLDIYTIGSKGIVFAYEDPVTKLKVSEVMQGTISFDPAKKVFHGAGKYYRIDLTLRELSNESTDSIFITNFSGSLVLSNRLLVVNDGNSYVGLDIQYDLSGSSMTQAQLLNFVNWWINCIMPSF